MAEQKEQFAVHRATLIDKGSIYPMSFEGSTVDVFDEDTGAEFRTSDIVKISRVQTAGQARDGDG